MELCAVPSHLTQNYVGPKDIWSPICGLQNKKQTGEFTFYTMGNLWEAKVTHKIQEQIRRRSHMVSYGNFILSVMTCKVFPFPINFAWVVP